MTYIPLKKGKPPLVISSILFLCTIISLVFFALDIGERMILYLMILIFAGEALSISLRYILSGFVYTLDESTGFTVTRTQGTKRITVCNLPLSSDTAVAVIPKIPLKEIKNKYGKIIRRFNYCANMFPDESYLYIYEVSGGINVIEIEANTDFYQMFKLMIGQQ